VDAAGGEIGIGEVVGENIGVGVNYTEQIIAGVRKCGGQVSQWGKDISYHSYREQRQL
jgi:hypothetical protein